MYEDEIQLKLSALYRRLKGVRFRAAYEGIISMPQTGNERDVLTVPVDDPFAATLRSISNCVMLKYGPDIWKGITGPEQGYTEDYRLWVESLQFREQLEMYKFYRFEITKIKVFKCRRGKFSFGVSISVKRRVKFWAC